MKSLLLAITFVATFLSANAQTFTDAVDYNDFIVDQQNKVGEKILLFTEKFSEESMTKEAITPALEDLLATAKASVAATKKLGPFDGETQLRDAALALFQFYVQIIDKDYREMVNVIYGGNFDDTAMTHLNEIIEKIQTDEASYDANFQAAQGAFAIKHNIILGENELQDEIDQD